MQSLILALLDLRESFVKINVCFSLGVLEVKQRYQRSVLGPWWLSISMLIFVCALGAVFSRVFSVSYDNYLPYFSAGYLMWMFVSSCINESTEIFRVNSSFIKQIKLPVNFYILKFMIKNSIVFCHNFLVVMLLAFYFKIYPGPVFLWIIPGFFLVSLNLYWISFLVGMISARFRDMVPIVNSCMHILFLATPISWSKNALGSSSKIIQYNPFVYFLDVVRDPLLGNAPDPFAIFVLVSMGVVGLIFTLTIFGMCRSQIPHWVD